MSTATEATATASDFDSVVGIFFFLLFQFSFICNDFQNRGFQSRSGKKQQKGTIPTRVVCDSSRSQNTVRKMQCREIRVKLQRSRKTLPVCLYSHCIRAIFTRKMHYSTYHYTHNKQMCTCMTLMLNPVSCASCSRIWRVGFGVWANASAKTNTSFRKWS